MTLADELTKKWIKVINQSRHLWTWTEDWALAYCCEAASKATHAVELGTYLGASAFCMLKANPKLHLWCVDNFEAWAGMRPTVSHLLGDFIKKGRCELITGDSIRGAEMLVHMKGKLDYVWVDDGHATEDVLRDIRCFWPLVKSGGEMFGHDFDDPPNDVAQGVMQSVGRNPGFQYSVPVPRVWSARKP